MLYPFTFEPIFKQRIWGGRQLETLYHKTLPPGVNIGESWEISDRPGDASVISNGSLAGRDLRWLMEHHERELLGSSQSERGRFPLLIKILDARETLSLQVHPPAAKAAELGGDPKTEMWYVAQAQPGAELFVGLKPGVTRENFLRQVHAGTVANCFHRVPVKAGDAMFLPSGRVHALGGGLVIFEIQQNSDTTYRVFDWNRIGDEGKPRELHIPQSMESIDFSDVEPSLCSAQTKPANSNGARVLVHDPLFCVETCPVHDREVLHLPPQRMQVIGVVSGGVQIKTPGVRIVLNAGQFALIPACVSNVTLTSPTAALYLRVEAGSPCGSTVNTLR